MGCDVATQMLWNDEDIVICPERTSKTSVNSPAPEDCPFREDHIMLENVDIPTILQEIICEKCVNGRKSCLKWDEASNENGYRSNQSRWDFGFFICPSFLHALRHTIPSFGDIGKCQALIIPPLPIPCLLIAYLHNQIHSPVLSLNPAHNLL